MHEDPVTKSKRVTNSAGTIVSTIEMDPWGADIPPRSNNAAFQPKKFTSYDRDGNGTDEAMFRRYNRWQSRFDQPDPYGGSYDYSDPQSFNRYSLVNGDPVNFVDPSGLMMEATGYCGAMYSSCAGSGGGGYEGTLSDSGSYQMGGYNDLPGRTGSGLRLYDERVGNVLAGYGFFTNEEVSGATSGHAEICIDGQCWDAGTFVYPPSGPFDFLGAGTLDQWPPQLPRPGGSFGWPEPSGPPTVRLPPGIRTTPTTGQPGIKVDPNYVNQPRVNPSNPQLTNLSIWQKIGFVISAGARAIANMGGRITIIFVSPPAFNAQRCRAHPNDSACGGSGGGLQ